MNMQVLFALLLLTFGTNALADVIYEEAIDGDAGAFSNGVDLGVIAPGEHDILTTSSWFNNNASCNCSTPDLDFFFFEIAPNTVLTELRWYLDGPIFDGDIFSQTIVVALISLSDNNIQGQLARWFDPELFATADTLTDSLPFGSDTYQLVANNAGGSHLGVFSSTWSSRLTVTVEELVAVPEPNTLALLCLGLVGIAAKRKESGT